MELGSRAYEVARDAQLADSLEQIGQAGRMGICIHTEAEDMVQGTVNEGRTM